VGRVVELALLDQLLDETRAGTPVTALSCGEAGAGKTRLLDEVTAGARDRGTRTLVGNCTAVGRTSFAFAPFVEALRPVVQGSRSVAGPGGKWWNLGLPILWLGEWAKWPLGTRRIPTPDDAGLLGWLGEVQRGPRAIRIELEPFSREGLAELIAGVLGERPPAELVSQVYERSGGNAFLAEQLLAARKRGVVVPSTVQGWCWPVWRGCRRRPMA
jgi:predicted ATPase